MANTNTDLTDEDAADLQFPKDGLARNAMLSCISNNFSEISDSIFCANCYCEVLSQYILCDKCGVNICLECFSKGAEFLDHKSDHDYRILNTKFILFDNSDWTAEEELTLLDSILNYGNWNSVSQQLPNRSMKDIVDHYEYFYLDCNGSKDLPKNTEHTAADFPQVVVPYRFQLSDSDEPPRYLSNTIGYQSLAGYNAARSDFENEYDNNAEDLLSKIEPVDEDDPQYELLTNLQCSIVQCYNRRLKERQRWKNVISRHGLLLLRKTISWLHRFDMTIHKPTVEKLIRFMQYCDPLKFNMLLEGLHRVGELKIQISRLILLRKKGITTLSEGRLYMKLQQIHEDKRKSLKLFRSNSQFNWRQNKDAHIDISRFTKRRSTFAPIEIIGLPGYTKLTEKERELCRNIRLVPASYLQLREVLVAENKRNGYVKLQTARRLLKIDVNKTRKLYDFLIAEGYIR